MARQRFIWPTIWSDPVFGRLKPDEQVFFIGLFSIADDDGRLLADPAHLRAQIFAYKDYSLKKVKAIRDAVVREVSSAHLYSAHGQEYIALLKWRRYQKPKYPKASVIPPPFLQDSGNPGGTLEESSAKLPPQGWVGLGWDGKRKTFERPTTVDTVDNLLVFAGNVGLTTTQRDEAMQLPVHLVDEAIRRTERFHPENQAAYFCAVVRDFAAARQSKVLPLEERLESFTRNVRHALTDDELALELREKGADETLVARLLSITKEAA
ncbi:MAG: hypothetical protein NUW01_13025 [Gemmatimonadaceae bacterium]|nr:hypothetical protein [Gemmatimonadaceae bacterium]